MMTRKKPKRLKLFHATPKSNVTKMLKSGKVRGFFTKKFRGDNSATYYARVRKAEGARSTVIVEVSATRGQLRKGYRGGYDPAAFVPRKRKGGRFLDSSQIVAIHEFDIDRGWVRRPVKKKKKK